MSGIGAARSRESGRRGRARAAGLAAIAIAVGLTACGGGDGNGEEDEVRETFQTYREALAAGDGETACSVLAEEEQQLFVRGARTRTDEQVASCPEAIAVYVRSDIIRGQYEDRAAEPIESIEIEGDTAVVSTSEDLFDTTLTRTAEGWRVSGQVSGE